MPNKNPCQSCDTCKIPCETRSIQITLPKDIWHLLEELHDLNGTSPGEVIRLIVKVSIHQILEETAYQVVQFVNKMN